MLPAVMSAPGYRFRLGDFRCVVVSDGAYTYPNPARTFFIDAPTEELREKLLASGIRLDEWTEFVSDYNCLLVETGAHRVLIDTGGGALSASTGKLQTNLQALGFQPEDIDTVILTHAHSDHTGGNTRPDGRSAFPTSRFKIARAEWDFWTAGPDLSRLRIPPNIQKVLANVGRAYLQPIREQVDLVEPGEEIEPGIRSVGTPGHTPGHLAIDVSSRGEHLLYVSDAILHTIHIEEPGWNASLDISPGEAADSRRLLLNRATSERALVHGFHFPFPGLGHVEPAGETWKWNPSAISPDP